MSNPTPINPATTSAAPAPAKPAAGNDPAHLFDRLSILYKYRWTAITVFALVVTWVMVDSYTRIPAYRAMARVLVEDLNADVATPSEIARSVPRRGSRDVHADAAAHHERPRPRAARRVKTRHEPRARIQRAGSQADAARRDDRVGQVHGRLSVSPDHVDSRRSAGDGGQPRGDQRVELSRRRCWPVSTSRRSAAASSWT